jgi:hypothetical protein
MIEEDFKLTTLCLRLYFCEDHVNPPPERGVCHPNVLVLILLLLYCGMPGTGIPPLCVLPKGMGKISDL